TTASGTASTAIGGLAIASGYLSTAIGLSTTASGDYSTAMGNNTIASGLYSTALGYLASSTTQGSFVYGDSSTTIVTPSAINQFVVRASGGTTFYSNAVMSTGVTLAANGASWARWSDRNRKEDF